MHLGGVSSFSFSNYELQLFLPPPRNCLKIQLYPAAVLTFFFFTHRLDKKDEAFNFNLQRCLGLEWILSLGKALSIPWKKKLLVCMKWIFRAVGGLQSLKDFFILFVEHPFLTVFLTRFLWRYYYFKQHHTIGNPGNPNLALRYSEWMGSLMSYWSHLLRSEGLTPVLGVDNTDKEITFTK